MGNGSFGKRFFRQTLDYLIHSHRGGKGLPRFELPHRPLRHGASACPLSRRRVIGLVTAAPLLTILSREAVSGPARRWSIAGSRVEKLDGLDSAMQGFMQQHHVRAGSLAVARRGKILFERAYTWAEAHYPLTQPSTLFRLASVSKAFTEALIYELQQARLLDLDTPVFPWLGLERAALPGQHKDPRLAAITIRHLLDHRGGWDSKAARFDPVFSMREIAIKLRKHAPPSKGDIARFMAGEPLQFTPGTKESYSNFGYVMLGLAAEKAAGGKYADLVRERVCKPLNIMEVFPARTRKDQRLPNECYYDQPGMGLTPEFPDREVLMPLPYGGEGWLTEAMDSGGGLCASAGAIARMIGHYAVWGLGLRRGGHWARSGSMAGTSSYAASRGDGFDFCAVVNTRDFGNAAGAFDALATKIHAVLAAARPA